MKDILEQMKHSEWITLLYLVKDFHIQSFTTRDGKTHKFQKKVLIGIHMSRKEFKRRRLKAHPYKNSDENIFMSTRKLVVNNNSELKTDLMKQGWIKLGVIPEPDFAIRLSTNIPDKTIIVPVVESYRKQLNFVDKRDRNILIALMGKTLVCTGPNTFKILEK